VRADIEEVEAAADREIDILVRENTALRVKIDAALKIARKNENPTDTLQCVVEVLEGA